VLNLPENLQFGGWLGLILLAFIAWMLIRIGRRGANA
jgi:hypothetical protein